MGPLRLHRPLIRATRVQTLAISSTLMTGLSLLMGTLVMAGAVGGIAARLPPLLAEFEPLRQITGGIRSILYYDAQGDAGLTRGWAMMAAGLLVAVLFGFGVLRWYDRKGLYHIPVETEPEKNAIPA